MPKYPGYLDTNKILNPSFEVDTNADGLADNWTLAGAPVCVIESTIVLDGCRSQKMTTDAAEGIYCPGYLVAPAGTTKAVAYAWVCRPAAGSDILVQLVDSTAGVARDAKLLSAGGWQTKVAGGNTWHRIVVSSNAIVAGNTHYLVTQALDATPTVFYVDMAFLKWGTIICPDPTPSEDVFNYVSIDGTVLNKYPTRSTWERAGIGTRGTREPRFSAYMSVVHEFEICNECEYNQLHDFWTGGGLHTVVMHSPDSGTATSYTGVAIEEVSGNRVDWYFENTVMKMSGILRP